VDFAAFILLNAVLLLRPAELVPGLQGVPLYDPLLACCVVLVHGRLARQLAVPALLRSPVVGCAVGLLVAVVLSHLSHLSVYGARVYGELFGRTLLYLLLLVACVNTWGRLRRFLGWLVGFVLVATALALAQYHGYVEIEALSTLTQREYDPVTGDPVEYLRLRGAGIFNDPNDLSQILGLGILVCLGFLGARRYGFRRWAAVVPLAAFGYALLLTQSRGGLLALLAGLLVLVRERFGWKRTAVLGAVVVPALLAVAGGRQASLSTDEATGQERFELWREGLLMFRESPVFGVGAGTFADRAGLVAHNSFVHCYAELGFLGGTLFLGAFLSAGLALARGRAAPPTAEAAALRPALLAAVVACGVSLMSLSRPYTPAPYIVLGLAAAYARLAADRGSLLPVDARLVRRVAAAGVLFLVGVDLFVRLSLR
jgi:hypothetical protein